MITFLTHSIMFFLSQILNVMHIWIFCGVLFFFCPICIVSYARSLKAENVFDILVFGRLWRIIKKNNQQNLAAPFFLESKRLNVEEKSHVAFTEVCFIKQIILIHLSSTATFVQFSYMPTPALTCLGAARSPRQLLDVYHTR